jgi:hypothetical protein
VKKNEVKTPAAKTSTAKKTAPKKPIAKKTPREKKTAPEKKTEVSVKTETSKKKATPKKAASKTTATKTEIAKKPVSKKPAVKKNEVKTPAAKTSTAKKATPKKASAKTSTAKTETKNSTKNSTEKKTSKKSEKIALYTKDIKKHYGEVDNDFLEIVVKNLGPSIYKKDAELVSCSDPKELDTVRKNFLVKKLGIEASQKVLDAAIQDVCEELKATKTKYRATFYYSLAKKFKKESVLS